MIPNIFSFPCVHTNVVERRIFFMEKIKRFALSAMLIAVISVAAACGRNNDNGTSGSSSAGTSGGTSTSMESASSGGGNGSAASGTTNSSGESNSPGGRERRSLKRYGGRCEGRHRRYDGWNLCRQKLRDGKRRKQYEPTRRAMCTNGPYDLRKRGQPQT